MNGVNRLAPVFGRWHLGFLIFILFAALFLWPLVIQPNAVPFQPRAQFTDLLVSHLPNALYLRDSLMHYGQLPLWNAQIMAGQPFAADPLAGLWYPPDWLLIVLPLPFGFNVLFVLHLAWAGYGLFRFLRAKGLSVGPALLGGVMFAGTPKLMAHIGAGHVSLVFAVAWTPWLLLAIKRAAETGGLKRGALAGACLALIFLADVRWAFYAAALGIVFWIASLLPFASRRSSGKALAWGVLAFGVIFLALSAVLALPLAEFLFQSNRQALTLAEAAEQSLPPQYLLGLLVPDPYGYAEYLTYLGLLPLLLAVFGIKRQTLFWVVAIIVAAAFSLGANFILFPLLFQWLPGLGFLRVPPRAWFIVALGVCVLAAYGVSRLEQWLASLPRLRSLSFALRPLSFVLLILLLIDFLHAYSFLLTSRPLPGRVPAADWLASQPGLFRVYSPSYSLPPGDGLQHVDGVDPLQLSAFVKFAETATGVRASRYSVTVPAFVSVDLATANVDAVLNAGQLGLLNVKYIVAEFPIDVPELKLAQTFGRTRVYENTVVASRAWLAGGKAEVLEWTPNQIRILAEGPGRLVLSEVVYPGWVARVDGVDMPIELAENLLRSVPVGAGAHEVTFTFQARTVYIGGVVTLLGAIMLTGIWRWAK